jgi:hypothetical protein
MCALDRNQNADREVITLSAADIGGAREAAGPAGFRRSQGLLVGSDTGFETRRRAMPYKAPRLCAWG